MSTGTQIPVGRLGADHIGMLIEVRQNIDMPSGTIEAIRGELVKVRHFAKKPEEGESVFRTVRDTVWILVLETVVKLRVPEGATVDIEPMPERRGRN